MNLATIYVAMNEQIWDVWIMERCSFMVNVKTMNTGIDSGCLSDYYIVVQWVQDFLHLLLIVHDI